MRILQVLLEAFRAMGMNRLRTALTMLGMIIGVGAVVLMLGIGQGAQSRIEAAIVVVERHRAGARQNIPVEGEGLPRSLR